MANKAVEQKLVVVTNKGTLGELGGISGPIVNPCYIPVSTLLRMIHNGKKIFEVNPENTQEKVQLTIKNLKTKNFPEKAVKPVTPVVKTVDEKKAATVKQEKTETEKKIESDFVKK